MKLKNGYTLSEVLITLGIIGVVAALTIPNIVVNTNNKELKPAINRAAAVLEQGFADVIFQSQNDNITEGAVTTLDGMSVGDVINNGNNATLTNNNTLFDTCAPFLNIEALSNSDSTAYKAAFATVNNGYKIYKFKRFNAYVSVQTQTQAGNNDDSVLKTLYIDGNGIKRPNTTQGNNPDIVQYDLLNNGHIVKHVE